MTLARASVIVVSRHRPQALLRCLTALRQQDHPMIEVVVVADPQAIADLAAQDDVKRIAFDRANISAARNLGLAAAAGDLALFIDDDAVPEPNWASRLCAAFDHADVAAATGFVRGRNGISYQWRAAEVDHLGQDHPLEVPDTISLHQGKPQRAVKTQGTNCAFRATILRGIGGFDPAFAFFLDEADVNLRLASHGKTAIVPLAQVHHGYMASARRRDNRAPTSLFDIAASTAIFVRKHAPQANLDAAKQRLIAAQHARLAQFRRRWVLARHEVAALMNSLNDGWQAGLAAPFGVTPPIVATSAFCPLRGIGPRPHVVVSGPPWRKSALHAQAARAWEGGAIVTVFCLAPSLRRHRMQFLPQGYWWQSGGIWGRAERDVPAKPWISFSARISQELQRISSFRLTGAKTDSNQ